MSTEYPNTRAHARLKATQTQQQKEVTKMTDLNLQPFPKTN